MAVALASVYSVVVAGAVGLGLYGLATRFRRFRGGGYYRRHPRHHYRYRRSLRQDARALERSMELIRQEDFSGCGMSLLCELAGKQRRRQRLSQEELAILDLVGPGVKPGVGFRPRNALNEYKAAKGFGATGGDCGAVFTECPLNGTALVQTVVGYLP